MKKHTLLSSSYCDPPKVSTPLWVLILWVLILWELIFDNHPITTLLSY